MVFNPRPGSPGHNRNILELVKLLMFLKTGKMKNLIEIAEITVKTGKTTIYAYVKPYEAPHPQLKLNKKTVKEIQNAVNLLDSIMKEIGAKYLKPKHWTLENNWKDVNDSVKSILDMDFSDPFPDKEKKRIEELINTKLS